MALNSVKNYMEIISLHLPKTAGTSFRMLLQDNYKDDLLLDYGGEIQDISKYKCVHGHLNINKYLTVYPEAKLITWLRDPRERVISYYNYWKNKRVNDDNPWHVKFKKENPTLMQFARDFIFLRQELSIYLDGVDIEKFFFIGITERFDYDVDRLSSMMGWKKNRKYFENKTIKKNNINLTASERKELNSIMESEMDIYKKILKGK